MLTYFQSVSKRMSRIDLAVEARGLRESSLFKQILTKAHS